MEIATHKSRFLGGAAQLGSHFPMFGVGRLVISAPRIERSKERYYTFIDGFVRRLRPELARSFEQHNSVMEFERGPSIMARERIAPWRRPRPRLSGRKTVPKGPEGYAGDDKLWAVYPIYRAVRRHIWRKFVAAHRDCAIVAARRLGWDVEGERIATLCPTAEAFLRWRMFWEGIRSPADLLGRPHHVPYGVLFWLCDGAPVGADGWTRAGEQWVAHRLFVMDCLRNYQGWSSVCHQKQTAQSACWHRSDVDDHVLTHWAVTGNDSHALPLRLFVDVSSAGNDLRVQPASSQHRQWHGRQLDKVTRSGTLAP